MSTTEQPGWSFDRSKGGEFFSFTPGRRFRIRYSLASPLLLLSTTVRVVPPLLCIVAAAVWFSVTALTQGTSTWWIGTAVAIVGTIGLLLAMGLSAYREQVANPTFPVGIAAESYIDEKSIWIRRAAGTREFPNSEIARVRRAMGFAVIATTTSGSFVVPGALVPRR